MSTNNSDSKTALLATRVTPHIKNIVIQIIKREGLDVSEWLRNLIVSELRKRGEFQKPLEQEDTPDILYYAKKSKSQKPEP